jgi:hypothetical protein
VLWTIAVGFDASNQRCVSLTPVRRFSSAIDAAPGICSKGRSFPSSGSTIAVAHAA